MKFSVGGLFSKKEVQTGPHVVGRSDLGSEFSIGQNESVVIDDMVVTNLGLNSGRLDFGLKVGDRNGRVEIPVKQGTSAQDSYWFEYKISMIAFEPSLRARLRVNKTQQGIKPMSYDSDFWLKSGEAAAFEHGLIVKNKSTSRSRQGEFTNVILEMEHMGQRKEAILVSFAKGKEKFVYAQTKNTASFGPFDIKLNTASENEAVINVHHTNEMML